MSGTGQTRGGGGARQVREREALGAVEMLAPLALFLSGAAGLIFQIVWVHRTSLVFGVTLGATAAVMSSFMAGLGIGNIAVAWFGERIRHSFRTYALVELLIAATGITVTLVLPGLPVVLPRLGSELMFFGEAWVFSVSAFAFVLLLAPATAMGATLPLMVAALRTSHGQFGDVLGRLYGWNTVGGVVGALGAELVLIGHVGIMGSAWMAGLLNLVAAALAWRLHQVARERDERAEAKPARVTSAVGWRLLGASCLAGGCLLALEVIWIRFLSMFVIASTLTVSVMLAVVLSGIAVGGFCAASWMRRSPGGVAHLPNLIMVAGALLLVCYSAFQWITHGTLVSDPWRVLWFTVALTLPTAFMSGVIYTLTGEALRAEGIAATGAAGWLALANTAGAAVGPLVASFVLLPTIGMERAFLAIAATYALAGAIVVRRRRLNSLPLNSRPSGWVGVRLGATALFGAVVLFPFGVMERAYLTRSAQPYTDDGSRIIGVREGAAETVLLLRKSERGRAVYHRLLTNGFSMTGTAVPGTRYMRYFAYLPMVLHEDPIRRALVVCYGLGVTASAVTDIESVVEIDIVETSRDVIAMSHVVNLGNRNPLQDPRVRLHFEDGRRFLLATDARFDLITGEPPPPMTPGTVNLYTREYFQLIRDRLAEGGIATYWLPVARGEGVDLASIARAFCDAFDDCSLWNATPADLMLVGSRNAKWPVSAARFGAPWATAPLKTRLIEAGFERPEQIGATFIADAIMLRAFLSDVAPLTDDYPRRLRLTFEALPLSDPRALLDHGGDKYVSGVLDTAQAMRAFASSAYIRRLWPSPLLEQTLEYFEVQRIINRLFIEGANPLRQIEDLHYLLTRTELERLPSWLLGLGNQPMLADADPTAVDEGGAEPHYVNGLRALAAKQYAFAAVHLAEAERQGFGGSRALLTYALALDGQRTLATKLSREAQPTTPDARYFWQWMGKTFALEPGVLEGTSGTVR